MGRFFSDGVYFSDPVENKAFMEYMYIRNAHLYQLLQQGTTYAEASDLFGLTENSIRSRWKKYKHTYLQPRPTEQLSIT